MVRKECKDGKGEGGATATTVDRPGPEANKSPLGLGDRYL